ncbi:putative TetR family transcriptional regulator [Gordonia terrae NBRC 100016]|nr:putative TetR family transcriptional regulator [Gordonia terrae NBRC 100016]VTR08535.1 transcriptional regulator BetI [Clostridioides difficile]VTS63988.1 transcriptional regulator BetI [Gordonia terrae]
MTLSPPDWTSVKSGGVGTLRPRNSNDFSSKDGEMTQVVDRQARIEARSRDKFQAKRDELAMATLTTLAELGYARTSLREIAQNSEYSHGVLHYYFTDKLDLIAHAVRQYEAVCVTRYDEAVANATDAAHLRDEFADTFFAGMHSEASIHRLWYDLRNQSMFDDSFRSDVIEIESRREEMIWRVVERYCELSGTTPVVTPAVAYIALDGIFQRGLLSEIDGRPEGVANARLDLIAFFDVVGHH